MKKKLFSPTLTNVAAMLIFGTVGIFRSFLPYGSGFIALVRGVLGTLMITLVLVVTKTKPRRVSVKRNFPLLFLSGAAIGINWIMLFEAIKLTGVAKATLIYYMAPVMVILVSPLVLEEKPNLKKFLLCGVAVAGMVLVTGIYDPNANGESNIKGYLFALLAAAMYAFITVINKKISGLEPMSKTAFQLGSSCCVLLPYVLITGEYRIEKPDAVSVILLIVLGVVHTGVAYWLFFASIEKIKASTAAVLSFIDPASAVILSALFLHEVPGVLGWVGAVLILGAAALADFV